VGHLFFWQVESAAAPPIQPARKILGMILIVTSEGKMCKLLN
jgi:hypothetical protein